MKTLLISSILLSLGCIFVTPSLAQTSIKPRLVRLSGYVLSKDSLNPVPYATIIDKRSNSGNVSDEKGLFAIDVLPGDTVAFTAIGFESTQFVLPTVFKEQQKSLKVMMEPKVYTLDEVQIGPYNMQQFKKDFLALQLPEETKPDMDLPAVQKAGPAKGMEYLPSGGVAVSGPISKLYDKFSREAKEKRTVAELRAGDARKKAYDARYNKEFVKRITGLPDVQVEEFMQYCKLSEGLVLNSNEYEMILAIQDCLKTFKPNNN